MARVAVGGLDIYIYTAAAPPREMYPPSRMLNGGLDLGGCAPALLD